MKNTLKFVMALLLLAIVAALASCEIVSREHTHTVVDIPASVATCERNGSTGGKKCAVCGEILEPATVIPASHTPVEKEAKAATCYTVGNTAGTYCRICNTVLTGCEVIPVSHTLATKEGKAPTCTASGYTETVYCTVCSAVVTPATAIPATGHTEVVDKGIAADCYRTGTSDGKHCSVCKAVLVAQTETPKAHKWVIDDTNAATCTEPGMTKGKHCEKCGYVLLAQQSSAALGHKMTYTPGVTPTCTTSGQKAYYVCSNCDQTFSDKDGKTPLTEVFLPALTHSLSFIRNKEVTYPTPGVVDCYYCSVCQTYFTDATAAVALSDDPFLNFKAVLRFTVGSDTHANTNDKTQLNRIRMYVNRSHEVYALDPSYEDVDAICICGDITSSGTQSYEQTVLDTFVSAIDAIATRPVEFMAVMGNHEWTTESFTNIDYDVANDAYAAVFGNKYLSFKLNGYWFIGISPFHTTYEQSALDFLEEQLALAAADDPTGTRPIFVFNHVPPEGTVLYTNDLNDSSASLAAILKKYPQAVDFAGHTHCSLADPCSFWQGEYTVFNTGTMLWMTGNRYRDASGNIKLVGDTNVKGNFNSSYGFSTCYNHPMAWVVEVDKDGNIAIRGFDVQADNYVTETYMLYAGQKNYLSETRFDDEEIFFDKDAAITVSSQSNTSVTFTYDVVSDKGLLANNYLMELYDKNGKLITQKYIMYEYYNPTVAKKITWTLSGSNLSEGYTIRVYGLNPLYNMVVNNAEKRSEALEYVYKP